MLAQLRAAGNQRSRLRRTKARPSAADTRSRDPRNQALESESKLRSSFSTCGQAHDSLRSTAPNSACSVPGWESHPPCLAEDGGSGLGSDGYHQRQAGDVQGSVYLCAREQQTRRGSAAGQDRDLFLLTATIAAQHFSVTQLCPLRLTYCLTLS
jgi:hypothetical protein